MFITYTAHVRPQYWHQWEQKRLRSYLRYVGKRLVRSNPSSLVYHSHTKGKPEKLCPHLHISLKIPKHLYHLYCINLRSELERFDGRQMLYLVEPFKVFEIRTWEEWAHYQECYLAGRDKDGNSCRYNMPEFLWDKRSERVAPKQNASSSGRQGAEKSAQFPPCPQESS